MAALSARLLSTDSDPDFNSSSFPSWANVGDSDSDIERKALNKNADSTVPKVDCCAIDIRIVKAELFEGHTIYSISVKSSLNSWKVMRRFRDFHFLSQQLLKALPHINLPVLPPKRFWRSSTDPNFVHDRKASLEDYLKALVGISQVWETNELVLFLDDANSMMTYLWNLQKMRKIQEMLSSISFKERENGVKQVGELQDKISRMEMILMQQATGKAKERLSADVIRTLSGVIDSPSETKSSLSNQLRGELTDEHRRLYEDDDDNNFTDNNIPKENNNILQEAMRLSQVLDDSSRRSNVNDGSFSFSPNSNKEKDSGSQRDSSLIVESDLFTAIDDSAWAAGLSNYIDSIVRSIAPSKKSLEKRNQVFDYICNVVNSVLNIQLLPVGSITTNTFLPDSPIETTAFVMKQEHDSWFVKVNEALCMSIFKSSSEEDNHDFSISNISFVNSDVKEIHSMINNISVSISINQISALYESCFIDKIDSFIDRKNLFKRSLLLVLAWCRYDYSFGHTVDGTNTLLSSWTIAVILTSIFNKYGKTITKPIQALGYFLRDCSSFNWRNDAMTASGSVKLTSLLSETNNNPINSEENQKETADGYIPLDILEFYMEKKQSTRKGSMSIIQESVQNAEIAMDSNSAKKQCPHWFVRSAFPEKDTKFIPTPMVVLDPTDPTKNLTASIDEATLRAMSDIFMEGYEKFQKLCDSFITMYKEKSLTDEKIYSSLKILFQNTVKKSEGYNDNSNTCENAGKKLEAQEYAFIESNREELITSLHASEFFFGGKIDQVVLVMLIERILIEKGQMPVGEIGKNLQHIVGYENLSKRLKEQYGGLKKAIELSNSPTLHMGSEHPFNPLVSLKQGEYEAISASRQLRSIQAVFSNFTAIRSAAKDVVDSNVFHSYTGSNATNANSPKKDNQNKLIHNKYGRKNNDIQNYKSNNMNIGRSLPLAIQSNVQSFSYYQQHAHSPGGYSVQSTTGVMQHPMVAFPFVDVNQYHHYLQYQQYVNSAYPGGMGGDSSLSSSYDDTSIYEGSPVQHFYANSPVDHKHIYTTENTKDTVQNSDGAN